MYGFGASHQADYVYLNLSIAFDKINLNLLTAKLAYYGVNGPLLGWLDKLLEE